MPLLFVIFISLFQPAWATIVREKIWSLVGLNTNIGKFYYQLEPQFRMNMEPLRLDQTLTNFGGGYLFTPSWTIWLGGTWVTNNHPSVAPGLEELRLWQQAVYHRELYPFLVLLVRSRLEERRLQDFKSWNTRLRERITLSTPMTRNLSLIISDEMFINFNRPIWIITKPFAENRAYIGLGQQASPYLNIGVGYLNQYIWTRPRQRDNHIAVISAQIFV